MKIENLKVSELVPYEKNPRRNDTAVESVAESIKQFGFQQPIVIDSQNIIIAGHTRLKAAKKLGLSSVPCVRAEELTPEQVKAYRILDNKLNELAVWNFEALADESSLNSDFSGLIRFPDFLSKQSDGNEAKESSAKEAELFSRLAFGIFIVPPSLFLIPIRQLEEAQKIWNSLLQSGEGRKETLLVF